MKTRLVKTALSVAAAAVLAGCSVHAPLEPAPVETAAGYLRAGAPSEGEPAERWWEGFGDERLNTIIEEAFRANPAVEQAWARLEQARAAVGVQGSALFPQANLSASGGKVRKSTLAGNLTTESYNLSAAASYEIDLWRKVRASTEAARLDSLAASGDVQALYVSVAAEAAELYYLIAEQRAQLELTDQTIEAFRETLERVERRYREGLVPALDVYQSRQNLAGAWARRPVFRANLETAEHALSVLLGRLPAEVAGPGGLPEAPEIPAGLPSELLKRRPDVRAAFARLEAADRRVAAAVADRYPSFSLAADYGGASSQLAEVLDSPNVFWNLLVQAALPVVDGGRRRAEVDRTEAAWRERLAGWKESVLRAFADVEDALSAGRATVERLEMLRRRAEAAEGAYRLSLDRYLQGLSDYLPVLTAQQRLFDSRSELIAARRELISDRIQLARALGGTWPRDVMEERAARLSAGRSD